MFLTLFAIALMRFVVLVGYRPLNMGLRDSVYSVPLLMRDYREFDGMPMVSDGWHRRVSRNG